jgi:rubrerythrin
MSTENTAGGTSRVTTVAELLAHALAMETDAAERYGELADQMEMHRKKGVAAIFRRLEHAERAHLEELTRRCAGLELPHYAPWEFQWSASEAPETIAIERVHYQLSVREAVALALEHERRATAFFSDVAASGAPADVAALATEFAQEEREHIQWLEECLAREESTPDASIEDPDPPLCQE